MRKRRRFNALFGNALAYSKGDSSDAEVTSHQLMIRAGMIRN